MKLSNILLNEYGEFKPEQKKLEQELGSQLSQTYRVSVYMEAFDQNRAKNDPRLGKGFGSITFLYRDELPEDDFEKAKSIVTSNGYEVIEDQSTNYYEREIGERDYFPKIKFTFNL
tara:strand:+ start:1508 stop:1855 length:348 start_codon:yes stop_codon:yes gene_type:complete